MSITQSYRNWRIHRQTMQTLRSLDSRQLADIGLMPGDVDAMAKRFL